MNTNFTKSPYLLGLPMWSKREWIGSLYTPGTNSQSYLSSYSQVFGSVEGNTTFYALPSESTVSSWKEQAQPGFQFCFKLPRTITHGRQSTSHSLCGNQEELKQFFRRVEPLAEFLGPFMIQLPKRFTPSFLGQLQNLVDLLPESFSYAVEVRHPDFFNKGEQEQTLNRLLHANSLDRVCLDSRALFSLPATTDEERDAHRKKPRLPVHAVATAKRPIVRFIGSSSIEHNNQYLLPWVKKVKQWVREGIHPIVFIHTPDNLMSPEQAFAFHQLLTDIEGWCPFTRSLKGDSQMAIF